MSKRHKKKPYAPKDTSGQNKEIKERFSIGSKPRTKERTSPGELHKVQ